MRNESEQNSDELINCYDNIEFPSGDIDDLIFGKIELKPSER